MPTLDELGPPQEQKDVPIAVKWTPSGEDTKIQTGDKMTSQQQGMMVNKMPKNQPEDDEETKAKETAKGISERMTELTKLIDSLKK